MKKLWMHAAVEIAVGAVMLALLGVDSAWAIAVCGGVWTRLMLAIGVACSAAKHGTTAELAGLSLTEVLTRGTRPSIESLHKVEPQVEP